MFNFSIFNKAVVDVDLSSSAFRILCIIMNQCSYKNSNSVEIHNDFLMEKLGLCEKQVRRLIKELVDNGYVDKNVHGNSKNRKGNIYTLISKDVKYDTLTENCKEMDKKVDKNVPLKHDYNMIEINNKINKNINNTCNMMIMENSSNEISSKEENNLPDDKTDTSIEIPVHDDLNEDKNNFNKNLNKNEVSNVRSTLSSTFDLNSPHIPLDPPLTNSSINALQSTIDDEDIQTIKEDNKINPGASQTPNLRSYERTIKDEIYKYADDARNGKISIEDFNVYIAKLRASGYEDNGYINSIIKLMLDNVA